MIAITYNYVNRRLQLTFFVLEYKRRKSNKSWFYCNVFSSLVTNQSFFEAPTLYRFYTSENDPHWTPELFQGSLSVCYTLFPSLHLSRLVLHPFQVTTCIRFDQFHLRSNVRSAPSVTFVSTGICPGLNICNSPVGITWSLAILMLTL